MGELKSSAQHWKGLCSPAQGWEAGEEQPECKHSSGCLEVSVDHCDFSPHCKQPLGCKSLFRSGKEFYLFHVVQILVKKKKKVKASC